MICADSLVTLNFRVMHAQTGAPFLSTFEATPTTIQIGAGELSAALEARLIGLAPGAREIFDLGPGEAFGDYKAELIERVQRSDVPSDLYLEKDTVLSFSAPDGSKYPGLVRELTDTEAVIDFNHPLAGRAVKFEVEIIGVI